MTDRTVVVRLQAMTSAYEASMARAAAKTKAFGTAAQGAGTGMQNFGSRANQLGNRMTLGYSLPMIAFGKHVIDTTVDFSKSMNTMAAVAQVPGPELEKLRQLAVQLGEDTVFSANEAAQAELELAKAGISTADILGGALKNTLDLATAGDLDLATAATIAANAMKVFKLSGDESQIAADALAGAANASSADVGDLALALQQSSLAASRAGLSVTETTAALAAFADAGLKGSDAGTSLKTFLLGLVPSTIKARDAMKELGISFVDANGNIKPLAEIADILQAKVGDLTQAEQQLALKTMFGTDAYRAASVVMEEGRKGIEKYTAATSKQGNAADVAEGKMKGLPGVMEELSGSIETAVLQIGEEQLGEMMTDIAEGIQDALKAFKNLSPEMRANIVKWAAYGVALGPAAKLLGGITYSLGGIVKLGGAAARALGKVAAVETATTVAAGGKVAAGQGTLFKSAAPVAAGSAGAAATTGLGGPVAWAAIATAATIYANKKALDELGVSLTELGAIGKGIELLPGFGTLFRNTRLWQQLDEAKEGTRELGTAQEMVAVGLFDTVRAAEAYRNVSDGAIQATKKQRGQLAGLVGALDDLGRPLDATTQSMVNNLLKVGDWRGAFKLLQGELDTAGGKIEKHRRGIDDAAGAAADHEQKVRGMSSALQDVPERVSPRVELRGLDPVLAGLRSFQNALDGIDGFLATATVNVRTVGGGGYDNQRVLHSGGKAGTGAVRYGRQRRPDEFPSILQRGERVVTDHAFRELTRGRGALSGPLSISGRLMIPGIGEAILEGATIVVDRALNNDDDITRSRQALFDN